MNVCTPIHGGLLFTWGNGGRPPIPSRGRSGWLLITRNPPSLDTVLDDPLPGDALLTHQPPRRHSVRAPKAGWLRYRLAMWHTECQRLDIDPPATTHYPSLGLYVTRWSFPRERKVSVLAVADREKWA